MDQQTLIAIRKPQGPASPSNETFQPPRTRIETVEHEPKVAGISGIIMNGRLPARCESGVGMEQQQPSMRSRLNAGRDLASPASCGNDDPRARSLRQFAGSIRAAAIDDDNLGRAPDRRQGGWQERRGVQRWDDNRQIYSHPAVILYLSARRSLSLHARRGPGHEKF